MKFELFIAFRYLKAHRKQAVVSIVTAVAILGVTAGVMALNIALALNTGFQEEFQSRILVATSHVNVLRTDNTAILDYGDLASRMGRLPGVTAVSPAIYGQALLAGELRQQPAVLKGIPGGEQPFPSALKIIEGSPRDFGSTPHLPSLILGKDLAQSLGALVGENLRAIGGAGELSPLGKTPRIQDFRVIAIFESGLWEYDANWAFVPIETAQKFFGYSAREASALELRIADIYTAPEIARRAAAAAGKGFFANTWIELNRPLFSALRLEKIAMFIAIGLIVLVASLNIVITLTMMVMEKTRDIAILTAMGGTPKTAMMIFMIQGLVIGIVGTLLGDILGAGAAWYLDRYRVFQLEPQVYSIPYVPFDLNLPDLLTVSGVAVLISFLATLYPSRRAARLDPVEALRYE
ncbi:MAG: ABC transporter permease [Acidobacteria bacterium]|nr:ABC transporter permease [Acidobacteriota bacterium]